MCAVCVCMSVYAWTVLNESLYKTTNQDLVGVSCSYFTWRINYIISDNELFCFSANVIGTIMPSWEWEWVSMWAFWFDLQLNRKTNNNFNEKKYVSKMKHNISTPNQFNLQTYTQQMNGSKWNINCTHTTFQRSSRELRDRIIWNFRWIAMSKIHNTQHIFKANSIG